MMFRLPSNRIIFQIQCRSEAVWVVRATSETQEDYCLELVANIWLRCSNKICFNFIGNLSRVRKLFVQVYTHKNMDVHVFAYVCLCANGLTLTKLSCSTNYNTQNYILFHSHYTIQSTTLIHQFHLVENASIRVLHVCMYGTHATKTKLISCNTPLKIRKYPFISYVIA